MILWSIEEIEEKLNDKSYDVWLYRERITLKDRLKMLENGKLSKWYSNEDIINNGRWYARLKIKRSSHV